MDIVGTKVLTLFILAIGSFIVGLAALPLSKYVLQNGIVGRRQTIISSVLSCFGGGVLLATTMLHMLPEISEGLAAKAESLEMEFLPMLVVCSGFFLIYLVEELAETLLGGHHETETLHRTMSVRRSSRKEERATTSYGAVNKVAEQSSRSSRSEDMESPDLLVTRTSESSSSLREFFTILALSVHAVFEGLAVGLEESKEDVWKLFTAIACHKFIIAFCVCLDMVQAGTRKFIFFSYLSIFSLVSAVGIAIGLIITEAGSGSVPEIVVATLQGIAAGTLLYVVMFEVLNRERMKEVSGLLQLVGVLLGFGVMLLIEIFGPHHEHGDHDHEGEAEGFHQDHHDHHDHDHHDHDHHDHHDHHDEEMFVTKPATATVMSLLGLH